MTQISYIAGIGADEFKDRGLLIPERNVVNYTAMTDGEMKLTLLAEQVNMLAAFAPEDKDLQKAKNILVDALYKGVHRTPLPGGIHTGTLATVVSAIRQAQRNTRPAAGKIFGRVNGIGQGIGDPLVPMADCTTSFWDDSSNGWIVGDDPECMKLNKIKKILNDNLEKSSHHILYEFVKNPNATTPTVAAKSLNHRSVNATLSQISKVNNTNMISWVRNGIIRNNAIQGAGAIQPEKTIEIFKEKHAVSGIGAFPIVAIIAAIAAAITATAQLVASLKQQDPQQAALWNQFQGIGTGVFGPEGEDWQGWQKIPPGTQLPPGTKPPGTTGEAETDYLPLLLLGGAAALLL